MSVVWLAKKKNLNKHEVQEISSVVCKKLFIGPIFFVIQSCNICLCQGEKVLILHECTLHTRYIACLLPGCCQVLVFILDFSYKVITTPINIYIPKFFKNICDVWNYFCVRIYLLLKYILSSIEFEIYRQKTSSFTVRRY